MNLSEIGAMRLVLLRENTNGLLRGIQAAFPCVRNVAMS